MKQNGFFGHFLLLALDDIATGQLWKGSLILEETMRFLNGRSQATVLYSERKDIHEDLVYRYQLDSNFLTSVSALNPCIHVQSSIEVLQKPWQYKPCLTKDIWLSSLLSAQEPTAEVKFRPWLALFLGETRQLPSIKLIALNFFQLETVNDFHLHWNWNLFWILDLLFVF